MDILRKEAADQVRTVRWAYLAVEHIPAGELLAGPLLVGRVGHTAQERALQDTRRAAALKLVIDLQVQAATMEL